MITKTVIKILREDTTLQSLLGATNENNCPVSSTFNFQDTLDKQINVSVEYGSTVAFDQTAKTHDDTFDVYILVKDNISNPINTLDNITNRVLELLDLKGTTLDINSTVYWIQKLSTDFIHYNDIKFYELRINFRFVITES